MALTKDDFTKLTQREHLLHRPEMYVGETKNQTYESLFLVDDETYNRFFPEQEDNDDDEDEKEKPIRFIEHHNVTYSPALYKCIDELLVNALDHYERNVHVNTINIHLATVEKKHGKIITTISVQNNGLSIPVELNEDHQLWIPEMVFFHLLSGSNFNDEKRATHYGSGTFGIGSKATTTFSKKTTISIIDHQRRIDYQQCSKKNNSSIEPPQMTILQKLPLPLQKYLNEQKEKEKDNDDEYKRLCGQYDSVTIECKMDHKRFDPIPNIREWNRVVLSRVMMLCGCISNNSKTKKLKILFNGQLIPIHSFRDFIQCFSASVVCHELPNLSIGVCSSDQTETFQHFSFVNGVHTLFGGTHVDYVMDQLILPKLMSKLKTKQLHNTTKQLKHHIKQGLHLFVHAKIKAPVFNNAMKEKLKTKINKDDNEESIPDTFINKIIKTFDLVQRVETWVEEQEHKQMMKKSGGKKNGESVANQKNRLLQFEHLHDAHDAGIKKKKQGTALILVEGISAMQLILSGFSILPRAKYGVFPLKGKIINAYEHSKSKVIANEEIQAIVQILGLDFTKKDYTDVSTLRYERLILAVDQDVDASHILCLLVSFLHYFWPSLLQVPGFLYRFITPCMVATTTTKPGQIDRLDFYSIPDYQQWLESADNNKKKWNIRYLKGLASSDETDAKIYFKRFDDNLIEFYWCGDACQTMILSTMSHGKKKNEKVVISETFVKEWIRSYNPTTYVPINYRQQKRISYADFFSKELLLFAIQSLIRAVPSMVDGFKECQRKIMHVALWKRHIQIKVCQLASEVANVCNYRHGDKSLSDAVIMMGQTYIGSQNINLLVPMGQFGSRNTKKSAGSPRYISTCLAPITTTIFSSHDRPLLTMLIDEGEEIEPRFFIPIVPIVLFNAIDGIGMGYKTSIPSFDPRQVLKYIRQNFIHSSPEQVEKPKFDFIPYYHGFQGQIVSRNTHSFTCYGNLSVVDDLTFRITELPIKTFVTDVGKILKNYKEMDLIDTFLSDSSDHQIHILVKFRDLEQKQRMMDNKKKPAFRDWYSAFKLSQTISLNHMVMFNSQGVIQTYSTVEEIIDEFSVYRLSIYELRKQHMLQELENNLDKARNKLRFIQSVVSGELDMKQQTTEHTLSDWLTEHLFSLISSSYQYLLSIPISHMTQKDIEKLESHILHMESELHDTQERSIQRMWSDDLDMFETALTVHWHDLDVARKNKVYKNRQEEERVPYPICKK